MPGGSELAASSQRANELERQLDAARDELRARAVPAEAPPTEPAKLRRLRSEIDELQDMVRERNHELAAQRSRDRDAQARTGDPHGG